MAQDIKEYKKRISILEVEDVGLCNEVEDPFYERKGLVEYKECAFALEVDLDKT